jgi:hypothetical protein
MQRSKQNKYVRDYYRRSLRCKTSYWDPQLVKKDDGRYNLKQLLNWLEENKLLTN